MNRREQFKPENQCRAEGCNGEVFFKIIQGDAASDRRQMGNRSPLTPVNGGHPHNQQIRMFPEGSRILSTFCKKHTCSLFLTDEGCTFKKPIHDTVCAIHTKCPIPGCARAKSQYLDAGTAQGGPSKYLRHDFCPDHKCVVAKCPQRRVLYQSTGQAPSGQQGRFLTVCQQHRCKAEGCVEQSQEGRNSCRDHECRTPECRTIVEDGYPFCAIHIKCTVANCGNARYLPKGAKDYLLGCEMHVTCAAVGCSKLKVLGSTFCLGHTCQERGCDIQVTEGMYCRIHRCAYESCRGAKSWKEDRTGGEYCGLHTCRTEKCRESVSNLALYCGKHKCSEVKCLAKVLDEQLCTDHFKALYIAKGRGEASAGVDEAPRQRCPPAKSITYRRQSDEEWRNGSSSSTAYDTNHARPQPDRRATVSLQIESDYDDDTRKSVPSRMSHNDEEVDQW
ncbi:hypothetical protein BR93DRAFT_692158 [Coniochaeta sp. PMI_546]|nr:hypothetical protein BR93DRAFT_692158 [Coniochaeta sp. PMI_546]